MEADFEPHRRRRVLFDDDVANYEIGRPGYPEALYSLLEREAGLGAGLRVLEIGPGTGQATAALLDAGASVTASELGPGMARRLREKFRGRDLDVRTGPFEDEPIEDGAFDLVAAATSFHWVPPAAGLRKCAAALRSGGTLALWWNHFGDPDRPDPFHHALSTVLAARAPELLIDASEARSCGVEAHPHAMDVDARIAEIDETACFGPVQQTTFAWTGRHTAREIRAMFATFSPWMAIAAEIRGPLLDEIESLAADTFDGLVERPCLTPVYLARRR